MLGDVYPITGTTPSGQQDNPVIVSSVAPPSPYRGMAWITPTGTLKVYNGAAWIAISTGPVGPQLPVATKQGQVLQAGAAPGFTWTPDEHINGGRY